MDTGIEMPGREDHRNNFNLLRLLAAAQVVYMHSIAHLQLPTTPWIRLVAGQFPGVAVFFVISGFLVSDSYLRSGVASFFFKRALRIYPALMVNILVLELLMFATGALISSNWPRYFLVFLPAYIATGSSYIGQIVSHSTVGYSQTFFSDYPSGVLWTLTVELSFYAVLPIFLTVVKFSKPLGSLLIGAALAASFVIASGADNDFYLSHPLTNITIAPYFWVFALGALARIHWDSIAWVFQRRFSMWIVAYFVVCYLTGVTTDLDYKISPHWQEFARVLAMAGTVLSAAYSFPRLTQALRLDRNDFSYGLYLWHMLVVSILIGFGITGHWWEWPVVYGGGLTLAAASWFAIERPALSLKALAIDVGLGRLIQARR